MPATKRRATPAFVAAVTDAELRVQSALDEIAARFRIACDEGTAGDFEDWEDLMAVMVDAMRVLRWMEER
jgi:hypothetical protein